MHLKLLTAALLASGLVGLAGPALAGNSNGFGVGTSATTGVYDGIYGGIAGNVSAYRMGQDASLNYTQMTDTPPVNFDTCASRLPFGDHCAAVQGGTASSGYDETRSESATSLSYAFNGREVIPRQAAASVYADLSTGKVGASGTADYFENAAAYGAFGDTLTFTVAGATAATRTPIAVSLVLDGSFDPGPSGSSVQAILGFGTAVANISYSGSSANDALNLVSSLSAAGWQSYSFSQGATPEFTQFTGVYELIGASQTLGIGSRLNVFAGSQGQVLYPNTAAMGLALPTGVAFTSASGVFLSSVSAVPEPGSWALMLAGLGLLHGLKRRTSAAG